MAWAYKGTITITGSSTLLPSTQTNFPVLVKLDSVNCTVSAVNRIKTTANGGAVQNTGTQSGGNAVTMPFDLAFYSDSGLTTKIPWEVDSYDGTGGTLWVWVLMASCALSGHLYFGLGDAAVNTQQNTAGNAPSAVWDSDFKAVYHLPDGTTLKLSDSTTNANDLTASGASATTGQIDGGISTGGGNSASVNNNSSLNPASVSFSWWMKGNGASSQFGRPVQKSGQLGAPFGRYWFQANEGGSDSTQGGLDVGMSDNVTLGINYPSGSLPNGTWVHIAGTYNSSTGILTGYLNGASVNTASTGAGSKTLVTDTGQLVIGKAPQFAPGWYSGSVDEVRVSGIVRSADWTMAEYQSGLAPQTFAAVSLAVNSGSSSSLFRPSTLSGLGAGGSFFQNPLG